MFVEIMFVNVVRPRRGRMFSRPAIFYNHLTAMRSLGRPAISHKYLTPMGSFIQSIQINIHLCIQFEIFVKIQYILP